MSYGIEGLGSTLTTSSSSSSTQAGTSMNGFASLNLTENQRSQIRSILNNAKSGTITQTQMQNQISAVLTPTQRQTLQTTQQNQQTAQQQSLFANLNLTSAQQTQIQSILQNAKNGSSSSNIPSQIEAVLTPSQQATYQANLSAMKSSGHSGHHHGGGGSASTSSQSNADAWGVTNTTDTSSSSASTATVNGLTEQDLQNQVLAASSLDVQQLQYQLGVSSSNTTTSPWS